MTLARSGGPSLQSLFPGSWDGWNKMELDSG